MGLAIDSILVDVANPGATMTAATIVSGNNDSLTIRSFPQTSRAWLEQIIRRHNTSGGVRVLSPLLHDNVNGITFFTDQTPSWHLLPQDIGQEVYRGDVLTVNVTGDTTHHASVCLTVYYENLDGAQAQLYQLGDVAGNVKSLKALQVAVTASGTVGLWSDTAVNTTDKQLHSDSQYAVLGYMTDTALGAVGVKGQSTGNLRIVGPGSDDVVSTSRFFVDMSQKHGTPHIPVFSALDQGAVFASVADNAASTTANITLMLAELARPLA